MTLSKCLHRKHIFDPILILDLAIDSPQITTLTDCLNQWKKLKLTVKIINIYVIIVINDHVPINANYYGKSRRSSSLNSIDFQVRPDHSLNKVQKNIDYPIRHLDLSPYTVNSTESCLYDLVAVTCHLGSINYGHYYAICYNHVIRQWVEYNDTRVVQHVNPQVPEAYLLYYQKRSS